MINTSGAQQNMNQNHKEKSLTPTKMAKIKPTMGMWMDMEELEATQVAGDFPITLENALAIS